MVVYKVLTEANHGNATALPIEKGIKN